METMLVTDTQTPLGLGLAHLMLKESWNVVAAPTDAAGGKPRKPLSDDLKKKNAVVIPWNRSSPLSCKNVLLRGLQKFSSLHAACILFQPLVEPVAFTDLKYLDIETVLDQWIKGSILLARDLLSHFAARRTGSLCLVGLFLPKRPSPAVLDDLCRESLLVAFSGLVASAKTCGVRVNAFLSRSPDNKAYADFICRTFVEKCNKATGKLFYFQWK